MERKLTDKFKCSKCGEKFHYQASMKQHETKCGRLKIRRR
jgi:DNA-directed RNA polymerase subunit RPC12/RpoP